MRKPLTKREMERKIQALKKSVLALKKRVRELECAPRTYAEDGDNI